MIEFHTSNLDIWDVLLMGALIGSLIGWAIIRVQYTVDRANLKIEVANNTILRSENERMRDQVDMLEGIVDRQAGEITVLKANDWGTVPAS